MKILIIEDEIDILTAINNYLVKENYICELAQNFQKAEKKISFYDYDIILLDITLPDGNGLDLIKTIKKNNVHAGIIILSAKNSLNDKINGLDFGADDYMTKPFQLTELNSRIKAVLRRRQLGGSNILSFNEICINTNSRIVKVNDQELTLTPKEYDIILYLISNRNRVLTKEAIIEHLWHDEIDLVANLDFIYTHINNIRKKIKQAGGKDYITTLYNVGYKFRDK